MAIAIAAGNGVRRLTMRFVDVLGEDRTLIWDLNPTITDADIVSILTGMDTLSNAKFTASVSNVSPVTGTKAAAVNAVQNTVALFAALSFSGVNPINTAKTIYKTMSIPAYIGAIQAANSTIVTNNATLNSLIDLLQANMTWEGPDGVIYSGGMVYDGGNFGSGPRVLDGK